MLIDPSPNHPQAGRFYLRIQPGDVAIVDRSLTPAQGSIVLALIDGEFTIKRYQTSGGAIVLRADNPAFDDITITEEAGLEVWGVLRHSIRML